MILTMKGQFDALWKRTVKTHFNITSEWQEFFSGSFFFFLQITVLLFSYLNRLNISIALL